MKGNKLYLIFIFLMLIINELLSQQYEPIYEDSITEFEVLVEVPDGIAGVRIKIVGDSLVNNIQYKKTYTEYEFIGLFREDSLSSKAWFLGKEDDDERLIMDLNLSLYEEFNTESECYFCSAIDLMGVDYVSSIDSINGLKRINFICPESGGYVNGIFQFIEGFGPTTSIIYLANECSGINILTIEMLAIEKYVNSELKFSYNNEEDSSITSISYLQEDEINFDIYPNPFSNEINFLINKDNQEEYELEIYSLSGKCILKMKVESNQNKFDFSNLENGFYLYKTIIGNMNFTGKIIKMD